MCQNLKSDKLTQRGRVLVFYPTLKWRSANLFLANFKVFLNERKNISFSCSLQKARVKRYGVVNMVLHKILSLTTGNDTTSILHALQNSPGKVFLRVPSVCSMKHWLWTGIFTWGMTKIVQKNQCHTSATVLPQHTLSSKLLFNILFMILFLEAIIYPRRRSWSSSNH